MKKQRETRKENQRSETIKNLSLTKRESSLPGNSVRSDSSKNLLIQNAIKGPPGRSRSPGMNKNKIQPDTLSNKPYFNKTINYHAFTTIK